MQGVWSDFVLIGCSTAMRVLLHTAKDHSMVSMNEIKTQAIKDQLRTNTDNLMERGGFGSPTIFINENDMYFGNDRLQLVKEKILGNF